MKFFELLKPEISFELAKFLSEEEKSNSKIQKTAQKWINEIKKNGFKAVAKYSKKFETYSGFALALFVGIPLPVTGAWSGCLLSWILDLDRKKSILSISLGVIIAGILVFFGTLGFLSLFS